MSQPLTDAINALTTYANSVTGASDTTLSDAVDSLVDGYGGGGGGSAVSGTFTPSENLRSITLSDAVGKSSILIYPKFDLATADITARVHWGCLISNGKCILVTATNTGKNAYTASTTMSAATGETSTKDTFNSSTGTVTITGGADNNYGGYFVSGKQYGYVAW